MTTREKEAYRNLRKVGWSREEAQRRAKVIAQAEAGPCKCPHVRHLPGDNRCPDSTTYTTNL